MTNWIDGLGAPFPGWVAFVLQMTVVFTVAGALVGLWDTGEVRRFARAGLLLGALDGLAVVGWSWAQGHPLPAASPAALVVGIGAALGALVGALGLLPSRLCGMDARRHPVRGGVMGLVTALLAAVVNAHWAGLIGLARSAAAAAMAAIGWVWEAIEALSRPLATFGVGVIAGQLAALMLLVAAGARESRSGLRRARGCLRWGGAFVGLIAVQAGALAPDLMLVTGAGATIGAVLALAIRLRRGRRDRASAVSAVAHGAQHVALGGALAGILACVAWSVDPLALVGLVAVCLAALVARTRAARALGLRALSALPARREKGAPEELPADLTAAARLTGVVYGTNQLVMAFPGLLVAVLARDLDEPLWVVILAMGAAGLTTPAAALYRWGRGGELPPRLRAGAAVLALGVALAVFASWPSLVTFVAMQLTVGAVTPTARLVRRTVARQFPGHEGSFVGRAQKWSFLVSGLGGIVFAAAAFGATDLGGGLLAVVGLDAPDWRGATCGLGAWVAGVALFQATWRRLPARGGAPEVPVEGRRPAAGLATSAWARLWAGIGRDWRTVASPTVREAVLASVGIYGAFQVIWSRLHPEVTELVRDVPSVAEEAAGEWASLIVALMGLSRLASIPWVRKHGDYSNESAKQSASQASWILVVAPLCGLAAVGIGDLGGAGAWWLSLIALALLGLLALLAECGGNPTSTAMTAAIARERASAELIEALARTAGALFGAAIASVVGRSWPFAVLAFAVLAAWAVSRWREKPSAWGATCEDPGGSLSFAFEPVESQPAILKVRATTAGAPVLDRDGEPAYWHIWRGDRLAIWALTDPSNPRSDRFEVARLSFVWTVGRHGVGRGREARSRLLPGLPFVRVPLSREPLVVGDRRRGTLTWLAPVGGRRHWVGRDGGDVLEIRSEALTGWLEIDHLRHGSQH